MSLNLQKGELLTLEKIRSKDLQLREYLLNNSVDETNSPTNHLIYIQNLANLLGNLKNQSSAAACILAREYLSENYNAILYDSCHKAQGAKGLDVDCLNNVGERIVAEIKTTLPYGGATLGAKQAEQFHKDLDRLTKTQASLKFFFVLNAESKTAAEHAIKHKNYDSAIKVVNLLQV